VARSWPHVRTMHALPDGELTKHALDYYPGLWKAGASEADGLRIRDLKATEERVALMRSSESGDYFRSLQVKLAFAMDQSVNLGRMEELSRKTNQFNLNLKRLREVDLAFRVAAPNECLVSIRLSDRLSDSGDIGLVVGRLESGALTIEEVCISCRALGRNLEDAMIGHAISFILRRLPAERVCFQYREGPRNTPARQWLARLAGHGLESPEGTVELERPRILDLIDLHVKGIEISFSHE